MTHGRHGPRTSRAGALRRGGAVRWLLLVLLACTCMLAVADGPKWLKIAADKLHDPDSPAVGVLQEPEEALRPLPRDEVGNQVRWVHALDQGLIQPRTNILPETKVNLRLTEVLLVNTADRALVLFPHRQHTAWLDCSNCHDKLFRQEAGATKIGMFNILNGEKCGLCHGAVAFPLTECNRCHSVERDSPRHQGFAGRLVREGSGP